MFSEGDIVRVNDGALDKALCKWYYTRWGIVQGFDGPYLEVKWEGDGHEIAMLPEEIQLVVDDLDNCIM